MFQVKPLHDAYKAALSSQLTEAMNTFWAECYEASKASALKRHREVAASKLRFQVRHDGNVTKRGTAAAAPLR